MLRSLIALTGLMLAGCVAPLPPEEAAPHATRADAPVTQATLERVANRVMPVAIEECRKRSSHLNCSFQVGLDLNPDAPPNAFQTVGPDGRPQLVFNTALLADLENADELAFILGHEAAHHIQGHLIQTNQNATTGAILGGLLATALGADPSAVDTAARAGATVGARAYSKDFELEADALGARITKRAGYDPVRGAAFFTRIADPGNRFLGTHPPNADRIATVRRAAGAN